MGIREEMERLHGPTFFDRPADRQLTHHWQELCVCGHIARFHSPTVGGAYRLSPTTTQTIGGQEVTISHLFDGCVGAPPLRGFETETRTADREARTIEHRINPTCPCTKFQPVARVDRPNRYWCQRIPTDHTDPARHPATVGVRAFLTFLSRRKGADPDRGGDPAWAAEEFDRRFVWLDGVRVCGLSKCTTTDDVWPVYVDGERSELRCAAHR